MKLPFLTLCALTGTLLLNSSAKNQPASEADLIQGDWSITSLPPGWKRVPGVHVVITPGTAKVYVGALRTTQIAYTLDPAKKAIVATRKEKGDVVIQRGTYSLNGDTLNVSVSAAGKPRPATPVSSEGGAMPWQFHRKK
jgi:hypothetical protein